MYQLELDLALYPNLLLSLCVIFHLTSHNAMNPFTKFGASWCVRPNKALLCMPKLDTRENLKCNKHKPTWVCEVHAHNLSFKVFDVHSSRRVNFSPPFLPACPWPTYPTSTLPARVRQPPPRSNHQGHEWKWNRFASTTPSFLPRFSFSLIQLKTSIPL